MKLNKKKVAVLGLAGLLALGGAGGALAYIITGATQSGTREADSALYATFDGGTAVANVENLTPSTPQYLEVKAVWSHSAFVPENTYVKATFTLTDTTVGKLSVAISNTNWSDSGAFAVKTLTHSDSTYTVDCGSATAAEKSKTYYLKFMLADGSQVTTTEGSKLTIVLSTGAKSV